MNKIIFKIILLTCVFLKPVYPSKFGPPLTFKTVVIDAGHGGKDPGSLGKKSKEKDITLSVALKLGKYIEEYLPDVRVVYTRKTDVFVELQERAEIANRNKADLFISVHCNANPKKEPHGSETYVMGIKNEKGKVDVAKRENASILLEDDYLKKYDGFDPNSDEAYIIFSMYQDAYLDQSLNLSAKIQKQYKERAGRSDKGVKRASLWVLWRTAMPSLLTEIGFITNLEEENFISSEKGQDYIASSIFRALREYKNEVEGKSIKYNDAVEKQEPYQTTKDTVDTKDIPKENQVKVDSVVKAVEKLKEDTLTVKSDPSQSSKTKLDTTGSPPIKTNKENKEIHRSTGAKKEGTVKEIKNISNLYKEKMEKLKADSSKYQVDDTSAKTIYKVQIASGDKKIPLNSSKFKDIGKVGEYVYNNMYKYTAGEFETEAEATKLQNELRKKGYPDAFVVAFKNGKRVPLK